MANMTVKDMNGKDFSFDTDKIVKISGDIVDACGNSNSVTDARRGRMLTTHDVEYVNSKGEAIDSTKLLKDMSSGKATISAIDVEAESTHSGKNHNYCIYYEDSMEKDAESFTNPFRKPMLKNHDDYSEPIGRIRMAYHGPSKLTDERSAIHTVTRVTDKDAIEKFLDGRYSTLSIGGTMGTVTCNICGKTILKDGKFKFCGHWKGETYKDQVCYWGVRDIDYNEHSVVNNPADDYAQVMKVTVITDDDKEKDNTKEGVGDNMDGIMTQTQTDATTTAQATVTDAVTKREKFISMIDELLGTTAEATDAQQGTPEETSATTEPTATQDGATTAAPQAEEKTVEDYQKELEVATQKIADLEQQLSESQQKVADAETAKEQAIEDAKGLKEQCIQLAEETKSLIADSIIELEKVEDDKIEERKQELVAMSMKDLHATKDSIKSEASGQPRTLAKAQNPTLPNVGEKGAVVTDAQGSDISKSDKTTEDSNKKSSVQDYADDIIKRLARR